MTKMTKGVVDGLQHHPCRPIWLQVGQRMRARRMQRGHAVHRVAEALGISRASYVRYESGETQVPALLLIQVAELLGVPVVWFFHDTSLPDEEGGDGCGVSPSTYRVATLEQRVGVLADSFRELDLEGQQHLLAIADALCKGNAKEKRRGSKLAPAP